MSGVNSSCDMSNFVSTPHYFFNIFLSFLRVSFKFMSTNFSQFAFVPLGKRALSEHSYGTKFGSLG